MALPFISLASEHAPSQKEERKRTLCKEMDGEARKHNQIYIPIIFISLYFSKFNNYSGPTLICLAGI